MPRGQRRRSHDPRRESQPAGAPKWNSDPFYVEMSRRHNQKLARQATHEALRQMGIVQPEVSEDQQEVED